MNSNGGILICNLFRHTPLQEKNSYDFSLSTYNLIIDSTWKAKRVLGKINTFVDEDIRYIDKASLLYI